MKPLNISLLSAATLLLCACAELQPLSTPGTQLSKSSVQPAAFNTVETAQQFLEARVERDPEDFIALNKLSGEYLQRLRETGDASYLNLAARTASASLASLPAEQNKGGVIALIQVEHASHNFASARDHAKKLITLEPNKGYLYQFLGDALLELGQYAEAEAAFRQMQALGGLHTLTKVAIEQRLARLALLYGDMQSAKQHFSEALKLIPAGPAQRELRAWTQWQLGDTAFAIGDYATAEQNYHDALATFPGYFHAQASLGRIRFARGDLPGAIALFEQVAQRLPDPAIVATLGDLYQLAGRIEDAAAQHTLVEQIGQLNGAHHNRQLALFYADHGLKPEAAYLEATKEYMTRRDIYGADAVAWTALKAGRINAAQSAIKEALKLGTKDAKLFYHAGMIAHAAGDSVEAQRWLKAALTLNPEFDPLQAEYARKALRALQ